MSKRYREPVFSEDLVFMRAQKLLAELIPPKREGNRRNPENWAEAANLDGKYQYTSRGYNMHSLPRLSGEHLDGFGLIDTNLSDE